MTAWPSGLRRHVQVVVLIGVGSNPTAVRFFCFLETVIIYLRYVIVNYILTYFHILFVYDPELCQLVIIINTFFTVMKL